MHETPNTSSNLLMQMPNQNSTEVHSILYACESQMLHELKTTNRQLNTGTPGSKYYRPFEIKMSRLSSFIYCSDYNTQGRSFVIGLLVHQSGALLYNLKKLQDCLAMCKSAISREFQQSGYTEYLSASNAQFLLTESFSTIMINTMELKKWSVRVKKSTVCNFLPKTHLLEFAQQNIRTLNEQLAQINNFAVTLLNSNVVIDQLTCEKCNAQMIKQPKEASYLGYHWRCVGCNHTNPSTANSVFAGTRVAPDAGIRVIYCFALDETIDETVRETEINHKTIQTIFSKLHYAVYLYMTIRNQSRQIGGPGMHVQMDETFVSKRKYNVGRMCSSYWVVGGICAETNEMFMNWTFQRDRNVMKSLISNHIAPGTIIATDGWRAYNIIDTDENLSEQYSHKTVNHKYEFVAQDGTHTQKIERLWGEFKEWKRERRGFYLKDLQQYIQEFMWRREIQIMNKDPFEEIQKVIKT
jgi:transposase